MKIPEIIPKEHYNIISSSDISDVNYDYQVTFRVTDSCNLKCDYCHWNDGINYKYDDIIRSVDKIFEFLIHENIESVLIYMHGGEPTTHPNIVEILEYIRFTGEKFNILTIIELQTNLICSNEILDKITVHINLLDISYHHIEIHKHKKFPNFIDNYNFLRILNYPITSMDIMLENVDDLDNFYYIVEKLLEYKNIKNSEMIYGFFDYEGNEETKLKHEEFYKKHNKTQQTYEIDNVVYNTNDLFRKGLDCRGWKCDSGIKSIMINGDGNVLHCGAHTTSDIKPFTNLLNEPSAVKKLSILHKTGTVCKWDYCGGDFYLGRHK